jgi:hypothetical protein
MTLVGTDDHLTSFLDSNLLLGLKELQRMQEDIDSEWFTGGTTPDEKRRHISFHLTILAAKAARLEEQADHGRLNLDILTSEVIPDLLVYAAQLSTLYGVDLAEALSRRHGEIKTRCSQTAPE